MTLARTGYGAGTRQLPDRPNVAVATLGTAVTPGTAAAAAGTEAVEVLETNLDDVTGEALGYVITAALAAGALDAWVTPAVMKKSLPAHVLHVLTRPEGTQALQELIFTETGTWASGVPPSSVPHSPATPQSSTSMASPSGSSTGRTAPNPSTTTWPPPPRWASRCARRQSVRPAH